MQNVFSFNGVDLSSKESFFIASCAYAISVFDAVSWFMGFSSSTKYSKELLTHLHTHHGNWVSYEITYERFQFWLPNGSFALRTTVFYPDILKRLEKQKIIEIDGNLARLK